MQLYPPEEVAFDHARDQQIRAFCDLIKLYWQIEPEQTFSELMEDVAWALEDPEGDYHHDDQIMYDQLYALFKQKGGDSDVDIGAFTPEGSEQ